MMGTCPKVQFDRDACFRKDGCAYWKDNLDQIVRLYVSALSDLGAGYPGSRGVRDPGEYALWAALDKFRLRDPALSAPLAYYVPREPEFQGLDGGGQRALRRFAHQQMYVLRHHHVSHHYPAIAPPYPFQHFEEQVPMLRGC